MAYSPPWKRSDTLFWLGCWIVGMGLSVWNLPPWRYSESWAHTVGGFFLFNLWMGAFIGVAVAVVVTYGILVPYDWLKRWFQRRVSAAVDERLRQLKPPKLSPP